MKKYFMTVATVALFAIGFAASDEESNESQQTEQQQTEQTEQVTSENPTAETDSKKKSISEEGYSKSADEPKEFLEKGHTYKTSRFLDKWAVAEKYCEYVLILYNDGSIELTETGTFPNHEFEDYTKTYECTMTKKSESKRDIEKQWYKIEGRSFPSKLFVDMEGRIYCNNGRNDFDAVGDNSCYISTFKKTK